MISKFQGLHNHIYKRTAIIKSSKKPLFFHGDQKPFHADSKTRSRHIRRAAELPGKAIIPSATTNCILSAKL